MPEPLGPAPQPALARSGPREGLRVGCDFSSRPDRRKPIVMARGRLWARGCAVPDALDLLPGLPDFARWLSSEPRWLGGFDFPFGLLRGLDAYLHML